MYNVVIIYGGCSPEHDVSVLTGLHLAKHITDDYAAALVYMTKENAFVLGSRRIDDYISGKAARARACHFADGRIFIGRKGKKIDCVINCCHGGAGEAGGLAAAMEIAGLPMTGCGAVSAYRQQDKIRTREILTAAGFTQPKFAALTRGSDIDAVKLPFPLIVKPAMLGSSIGISVAHNKAELADALHLAFSMGDTAIAEEFIEDMREVNIAVMRQGGEIVTSAAEAVGSNKFFSFEEKYMKSGGGFIKKGGGGEDDGFLKDVAPVVAKLATDAYKLFGSAGVVRTDCIVTKDKVILNENNTVPGFMAYHLWLQKGIPYGVVIDGMVREAITRHSENRCISEFNSEILSKNRQLVVEL